jgi:hypothetical protein
MKTWFGAGDEGLPVSGSRHRQRHAGAFMLSEVEA